jgi:broad specificity phosphatase PhoE
MQERYRSVRLSLVRHAQARAADDSYCAETPLSPLGQRQAAAAAQALLARAVPSAIYASPYSRCVDTARPLCEQLGLAPRIDRRLREFEFEKTTLAAILSRPDLLIWEGSHRAMADGETLAEFSGRVSQFLAEVAEQHLESHIVLYTHSGVIDAAVRWFVGLPPEAPWMHDLPLSNASITELEFWPRGRVEGGAPRYTAVLRLADAGHLLDCGSEM